MQQGAINKTHLNKLNKVLDLFPVIEIDINTSQNFNSLFEKFVLSNQCTIPDMLIAATALRYDIELFTFNIKDFAHISKINLTKHNINPLKKTSSFL